MAIGRINSSRQLAIITIRVGCSPSCGFRVLAKGDRVDTRALGYSARTSAAGKPTKPAASSTNLTAPWGAGPPCERFSNFSEKRVAIPVVVVQHVGVPGEQCPGLQNLLGLSDASDQDQEPQLRVEPVWLLVGSLQRPPLDQAFPLFFALIATDTSRRRSHRRDDGQAYARFTRTRDIA